MSRVAKKPIHIPAGVTITHAGENLVVKGSKGTLEHCIPASVTVVQEGDTLRIEAVQQDTARAESDLAGTSRSIINNMIIGVSQGFERKLELVGIGYRAQSQGNTVNLTLGYSHPINHQMPEGISVETPSQTEIVIKGIDKQKVGQVAAEIRAYRQPDCYKGKGVRYQGEKIVLKETKKK